MSILEKLYNGEYGVEQPKTPEFQALQERNVHFWEHIEEAVGKDYIDKKWDELCALEHMEDFNYFREGFRLGASLMLELL